MTTRPAIRIPSGTAAFSAWIEKLRALGRDALADAAERRGELIADARWPASAEFVPMVEGFNPAIRNPAGPDQ